MLINDYCNIKKRISLLRDYIDYRGSLELLAEESSELTQAAMKLIRVSEADGNLIYPVNKEKYDIEKCQTNLIDELTDVLTCVFLLFDDAEDAVNSFVNYGAVNERLDEMIARIEFVKDPVKVTVKYDGQTYDVVNKYESKSVRSFDLRAKGNDADPINHPNHYEMVGPFESFDIIVESLGIYGARQFCQGNIIKYQTRYKEKNGEEDLKKRHWYSRMDQMLAKCKTIKDYYKLKESDF